MNLFCDETDLSTFPKKTQEKTRFSPALKNPRREAGPPAPTEKRSKAAHLVLIAHPLPAPGQPRCGRHLFQKGKFYKRGGLPSWRIVVTLKAVRRATERNRWKRRIREILRAHKRWLRPGYEVILRVERPKPSVTYFELEKEILKLLKETDLYVTKDSP